LKFGSTIKRTTRAVKRTDAEVRFGIISNQPIAREGQSVSVVATLIDDNGIGWYRHKGAKYVWIKSS